MAGRSSPSSTRTSGAAAHGGTSDALDGLAHIGARALDASRLTMVRYDDQSATIREIETPAQCAPPEPDEVVWLNIDGTHDAAQLEALGARFGLHALLLDDVKESGERPKIEEYDEGLFIVLKMLDWDPNEQQVVVEQLSLVLGPGFVLTFQSRRGDVFDDVRERIKSGKGKLRKLGADHLAYALIDAIVDHYFIVLERVSELIEDLEEKIDDDAGRVRVADLHLMKRELLYLRKAMWPAREVIGTLARLEDETVIKPSTSIYLRDTYDHMLQVTETVDMMRELVTSMLDMYHTAQSNRMNEIMKVLTIISTVFIPLTFIAGIYGMNFEHMPELHWQYGYFECLAVMVVVAVAMMIYVRRNRWL